MILDFYFKADGRVRTGDLRFTKPLLYQLSYIGANGQARICTLEGVSQQIYSLPRLTTSVPAPAAFPQTSFGDPDFKMEPLARIELATFSLPWRCSTN